MVSGQQPSSLPSGEHGDRFAEVDRRIRFWWVAAFLALMITASLIRSLFA